MRIGFRKRVNDGKRYLGQRDLYWKLLRDISEAELPNAGKKEQRKLMFSLHDKFKNEVNGGKSTSEATISEFWLYYTKVQAICCETYGVTGMDEDSKPFDHGFVNTEKD